MRGTAYAVVFTWPDGRQEVRYRRPVSDIRLAKEVLTLRRRARAGNWESPYSLRRIDAKEL